MPFARHPILYFELGDHRKVPLLATRHCVKAQVEFAINLLSMEKSDLWPIAFERSGM
jgi:hypothetical protein